ncbi:hypothetical protein MU448_11560 [Streptococcus sp. O1]|uniref:hypothetical protein n=1 Tax=Streptococcus sp. O1 TaxID=2928735 RepID=UPI00211B5A8D|nr:hypothetical protein [Streptococcus sp. O1]MCQ9214980.1 hypothetical protein [Streptococcus sp. O1]
MTREVIDGEAILTSKTGRCTIQLLIQLSKMLSWNYEISIKAHKTNDEATAIRFGFESLGQMQEFSDISDVTTGLNFVVTVDKVYGSIYYHFGQMAALS